MNPANLCQSNFPISLDAIDLNHIPIIPRYRGSEVTHIWTRGNLDERDNDYFEFVIEEKDSKNDQEESTIKDTLIPCHICSVDVPKQYLKDHFISKKHNTFKKIINISLERLKKAMNQEEVFEGSYKSDSVYFCPSCVTAVPILEKIFHDKSVAHINSLMVDKILNDFSDLYESDEKMFTNETADNSNSQINNAVSLNIPNNPFVNNKINDTIKLKKDSIDNTNNSNKKVTDNVNNEIIPAALGLPQTGYSVQEYVSFLIKTKHLNYIKVLENNNLEIKTLSGVKVKILEHNFNSLEKEPKNVLRCILCQTSIQWKVKWTHLYEKKHVDLVTIPFENENCIRQFDSCWSHCAICNIGIQNHEEHILTDNIHKLHLNEALKVDYTVNNYVDIKTEALVLDQSNKVTKPQIRKDNDLQQGSTPKQDSKEMERKSKSTVIDESKTGTVCIKNEARNTNTNKATDNAKVSDKTKIKQNMSDVPEAKKNLEAYVDFLIKTTDLKEIKVLQNNYLEIKTVSGVKVKVLEDNFNGAATATKALYHCRLCRIINYNHLKWDHLYEKEHVDRVTIPFLNENCVRQIDDCWSHCALCNVNVQDLPEHLQSDEQHILHLNEALQTDIANNTTEAETGQNRKYLNALMCRNDDGASTSKQNNTEFERRNQITVNDMELCDTPKSLSSTTFHTTTFDDLKACIKIHRIDEKIEKSKIHYLIDLSDSPNKDLMCKVCKSLILNNTIKVKEHINSVYHEERYKKLLSINNIHEFEKYHFHCRSCDVCFVKMKELIHINSKQHLKNMLKINSESLTEMVLLKIDDNIISDEYFRCAICNLNIQKHNKYNIYAHLTSAVHINAASELTSDELTKMHYHIDLTNFPTLTCMVCNVPLTMNEKNIITHVNGLVHKQNYQLKLRDNKIVKKNNDCSCKICFESIHPMHDIVHCTIKKHINKINEINNNKKKTSDDAANTSKTNQVTTDLLDLHAKILIRKVGSDNKLLCIVCNTNIPNNTRNITEHLNGSGHRALYRSTLEENYIVKHYGDFDCKLCDIFLANGIEFTHISTKTHQEKMKDALKHTCVACNVKLTKNDENIRLHNIGEQHMKTIELALKNDIKFYADKCFCETCEQVLENESINEHLKNIVHIMRAFYKGFI